MKVHCRYLDGACATRRRYKTPTVSCGLDFPHTFRISCLVSPKWTRSKPMFVASVHEKAHKHEQCLRSLPACQYKKQVRHLYMGIFCPQTKTIDWICSLCSLDPQNTLSKRQIDFECFPCRAGVYLALRPAARALFCAWHQEILSSKKQRSQQWYGLLFYHSTS